MISKFRLLISLLICLASINTASALEIPEIVEQELKEDFPKGKFRFDGVFQNGTDLWIPILPTKETDISDQADKETVMKELLKAATKVTPTASVEEESINEAEISKEPELPETFLMLTNDDRDYLFSNGWLYTPIKDNTIKSLDFFDKLVQKQILKNKIVKDFVVPNDFLLPRDLAILSGHLPIKMRNVELATEREARYLEILKQEIKDANLELLSYDFNSGDFKLSTFSMEAERLKSIGKRKASPTKDSKLTMYKLEELARDVSLLSQLKYIGDSVFMLDYNKSIVYELEAIENGFNLIEKFALEPGLGLIDFAKSVDGVVSYLLTNKKSQLRIFDNIKNIEIKVLDLPSNPDSILSFSKDSTTTDFVVINSKGSNEVIFVSSFDHRIVDKVKVGRMPNSMAANSDFLFVSNKGDKTVSVIDWVSRDLYKSIDLEIVPNKLIVSPDKNLLFVLGGLESKIAVYELENMHLLKTIDLGPDLIEPKDMVLSPSGYFLLVGSSGSDMIGVVDMGIQELVKKIDIKNHSNKLIAGKFSAAK